MHEQHASLGTWASASKKNKSNSHVTKKISNEDYIKRLQAKIDRLKSGNGQGSKYPRYPHWMNKDMLPANRIKCCEIRWCGICFTKVDFMKLQKACYNASANRCIEKSFWMQGVEVTKHQNNGYSCRSCSTLCSNKVCQGWSIIRISRRKLVYELSSFVISHQCEVLHDIVVFAVFDKYGTV